MVGTSSGEQKAFWNFFLFFLFFFPFLLQEASVTRGHPDRSQGRGSYIREANNQKRHNRLGNVAQVLLERLHRPIGGIASIGSSRSTKPKKSPDFNQKNTRTLSSSVSATLCSINPQHTWERCWTLGPPHLRVGTYELKTPNTKNQAKAECGSVV